MNSQYIVVGSKSWNRKVFDQCLVDQSGRWTFIDSHEALNLAKIDKIKPRYIFFLHWSWKVSNELLDKYECVCFHMTDVPYGRGGSPLQNLIVRGHKITKMTALRMTQELDGGPVYYKEPLYLGGNAEEIYIRASYLSAKIIKRIIKEQPNPIAQTGKITIFKRRQPDESEILGIESLDSLYDHIRMLDAEGYPKSFIQYQGFRYEFSRAVLYDGQIKADVTITPLEEGDPD